MMFDVRFVKARRGICLIVKHTLRDLSSLVTRHLLAAAAFAGASFELLRFAGLA